MKPQDEGAEAKKLAELEAWDESLRERARLQRDDEKREAHLAEEILGAIQAETAVPPQQFYMPAGEIEWARAWYPDLYTQGLSTADLVSVIAVVDSYRPQSVVLRKWSNGVLHISPEPLDGITVGWTQAVEPGGPESVSVSGAKSPYDESYCRLPGLVGLVSAGEGSDFTRIAECNPLLETLWIDSWEGSSGHEGLAGLTRLRHLRVGGVVDDPSIILGFDTLEELRIVLPDNTAASRAAFQAKLPHCKVEFGCADGTSECLWED
ncbi:MAG: hypothetical protein LBJ08_03520 [Bifidobacteriaceae bacterium]|nr:hypothetical protein [Bifidobacteriaceae bacterium]